MIFKILIRMFQILVNIDKLGIPPEYMDFRRALQALRALDNLVSNPVLPAAYPIIINIFKDTFLKLFMARPNVTYPNKMHILDKHLQASAFKAKFNIQKRKLLIAIFLGCT